jgi:hypothetical protein
MDFNLWNAVFSLPILLILAVIFWRRDGRVTAAKLNALILPNPLPEVFSEHQPYRISIQAPTKPLLKLALELSMFRHLRVMPERLEVIKGTWQYQISDKKLHGLYTGEVTVRLRQRR